jgi:hypothetical protein
MAVLPGTGKDVVQSALFPAPVLDCSPAQDEITVAAIYAVVNDIPRVDPDRAVLLVGRTFSKTHQLRDLLVLAGSVCQPPVVIECVCDGDVARRVERDLGCGGHPASDRTFELYLRVKGSAEPCRTLRRTGCDRGSWSAPAASGPANLG